MKNCPICNTSIITQVVGSGRKKKYCSDKCILEANKIRRRKTDVKRTVWVEDKKVCNKCGIAKDVECFHKKGEQGRRKGTCAECYSVQRKNRTTYQFACKQCGKTHFHYDKRYTTFCSRECAFAHVQRKEQYEPTVCDRCGEVKGKYGSYRYCVPCAEVMKKEKELEAIVKQVTSQQERLLKQEEQEKERLQKKAEREAEKALRRIEYQNSLNKICTSCESAFRAKMAKQKHCPKCQAEKELIRDVMRGKRSAACLPINPEHFDADITLKKLFERDKGICYLCGITCNWNDYEVVNGHRVTGATYPSRDHIIALTNGGTHTWGNVKLACFDCNTKKGNKELTENKGQLQFYI